MRARLRRINKFQFLRPDHPSLCCGDTEKTWMPGTTSPGMMNSDAPHEDGTKVANRTCAPWRDEGARGVRAINGLLRRNLDPVLFGPLLQRLPVRRCDVPVDDGTVRLRNLPVRDARSRHRVVEVNSHRQKERTQNHSQKNPHRKASNEREQRECRGMVPKPPTMEPTRALDSVQPYRVPVLKICLVSSIFRQIFYVGGETKCYLDSVI